MSFWLRETKQNRGGGSPLPWQVNDWISCPFVEEGESLGVIWGCDVLPPHSLCWCLYLPASEARLIKTRFQRKRSEHDEFATQK